MSCEHTTFSLVFVNMPTGKRLRAQTKEVVVNVYEYFEELGRRKRTEGSLKRTSDATKLSRTSIKRLLKEKLSTYLSFPSLSKRFFSKPWWLYSCLKSQKTIPGYYFNNNCYNIPFVHIIRIVILNCHVTDRLTSLGENCFLLNPRRCVILSMWKVCH